MKAYLVPELSRVLNGLLVHSLVLCSVGMGLVVLLQGSIGPQGNLVSRRSVVCSSNESQVSAGALHLPLKGISDIGVRGKNGVVEAGVDVLEMYA